MTATRTRKVSSIRQARLHSVKRYLALHLKTNDYGMERSSNTYIEAATVLCEMARIAGNTRLSVSSPTRMGVIGDVAHKTSSPDWTPHHRIDVFFKKRCAELVGPYNEAKFRHFIWDLNQVIPWDLYSEEVLILFYQTLHSYKTPIYFISLHK